MNESGNSSRRCSAKNANTLPGGTRCPAISPASSSSRSSRDFPCMERFSQKIEHDVGKKAPAGRHGLFRGVLGRPDPDHLIGYPGLPLDQRAVHRGFAEFPQPGAELPRHGGGTPRWGADADGSGPAGTHPGTAACRSWAAPTWPPGLPPPAAAPRARRPAYRVLPAPHSWSSQYS